MPKKMRSRPPRDNPSAIVIFGEDLTDLKALKELILAIRPDGCPRIELRLDPPILIKGRDAAKARRNALDVAKRCQAESHRFDVRLVVAHEDCDDCEPAHEHVAHSIEKHLGDQGIPAVAATPAWEMEAWWFLWPEAVSKVNSNWNRINRAGTEVGLIRNAKEELRRQLRPGGKVATNDYTESDSPKIAKNVREMKLVNDKKAISRSFDAFAGKIGKVSF